MSDETCSAVAGEEEPTLKEVAVPVEKLDRITSILEKGIEVNIELVDAVSKNDADNHAIREQVKKICKQRVIRERIANIVLVFVVLGTLILFGVTSARVQLLSDRVLAATVAVAEVKKLLEDARRVERTVPVRVTIEPAVDAGVQTPEEK